MGEDYQPNSTEIVFSAALLQQLETGDTTVQCINIDIFNDTHLEREHGFTVEIGSVFPSSVVQCSASSNTTVLILDDNGESLFKCVQSSTHFSHSCRGQSGTTAQHNSS